MDASYFLPTERKWENSFWLSSPAPSHEKTTNCGGVSPGLSRSQTGWCGWAPVKAVEPSPIRRTAFGGAAAGLFLAPEPPCVPFWAASSEPEQPATPVIRATARAPAASTLLRTALWTAPWTPTWTVWSTAVLLPAADIRPPLLKAHFRTSGIPYERRQRRTTPAGEMKRQAAFRSPITGTGESLPCLPRK
ncbi:hypothetical protein SNARM312S_05229 [Streptomyces narbonensis]